MSEAPRLLFVPASGTRGAGEYFRCIALARTAQQRWPDAQIHFIINAAAGYAQLAPFPKTFVQGTPTYNTSAVNATISELRPHVVVFDSAGRVAQLQHARACGAATVYISSRFKTRWKGFRVRRMRHIDQHWLAWPRFVDGELTRWERFKLGLLQRPQVLFLDPVHERIDAARQALMLRQFRLANPYVLFCSGGGGYQRIGMSAPLVFGRAAVEMKETTGHQAVWVQGPNYEPSRFDADNIVALGSLTSERMIDLLAGARLAVISGGSMLLQAIGLGVPVLAAPVAADQPQRIAAAARRGVAVSAPLEPRSLARAASELITDEARLAQLRDRMRELGIGNGADQAVDALARLLSR